MHTTRNQNYVYLKENILTKNNVPQSQHMGTVPKSLFCHCHKSYLTFAVVVVPDTFSSALLPFVHISCFNRMLRCNEREGGFEFVCCRDTNTFKIRNRAVLSNREETKFRLETNDQARMRF